MLLVILLLELAGAGCLAVDLLELGDPVDGVLRGLRRVIVRRARVRPASGGDRTEGEGWRREKRVRFGKEIVGFERERPSRSEMDEIGDRERCDQRHLRDWVKEWVRV